ncbi:hypothetical protein AAC387_Pa06g2411 [Persea americana]
MVLIILAACSFESMSRSLQDLSMAKRHEQWMARIGRVYKDASEKAQRLKIFTENVEYIEAFNKAGHGFWLGLNEFTDQTPDEFSKCVIALEEEEQTGASSPSN